MQVLYPRDVVKELGDWGIRVPLSSRRPEQIVQGLLAIPSLAATQRRWLREFSPQAPSYDALLRVHAKAYVDRLLSEDPRSCVEHAFELREPRGPDNRGAGRVPLLSQQGAAANQGR